MGPHTDRYAAPANTEGRTASTDCGAILRRLKPGASGLATLSVAIRSTWLRVILGLANPAIGHELHQVVAGLMRGESRLDRFHPQAKTGCCLLDTQQPDLETSSR